MCMQAYSNFPKQNSEIGDSEPSVWVIVFSKDRVFQYLRTLFDSSRGATLDMHVLFRTDPPATGTRDVTKDLKN